MAQPTTDELRAALNHDLRKVSPEGLESVVDDVNRRVFTARLNGATLEFRHKQVDPDYWNGVKTYGSGPSSRIRYRRSPVEVAVKTKAPRKSRSTVAPSVALPALAAS